jgi:hypothetical protein
MGRIVLPMIGIEISLNRNHFEATMNFVTCWDTKSMKYGIDWVCLARDKNKFTWFV